jgi:hypothetical protein
VTELKQKIDELEGHIQKVEDENLILREYNEIFGDETDKLHEENEALKGELNRYRQIRIPRSIINPSPAGQSRKKMKSKEKSPDEANEVAARVRNVSL